MAISSSIGAHAPSKCNSHSFTFEAPPIVVGLVQHPLLSASIQVQILSIVDATGSAAVADIVAELPNHGDPVGAIMALVAAGILVAEIRGVLDAQTIVRRPSLTLDVDPEADAEPNDRQPSAAGDGWNMLPTGLEEVAISPLSPQIIVGSGADRRAFERIGGLHRAGVYILLNGEAAYVGVAGNVANRIANGRQAIDVQTVIAVVDRNDGLTLDDARALERMLWSRLAASGERRLVNGCPDGAGVDPERYEALDAMLSPVVLALRQRGLLFIEGNTRAVLAGPRAEPGRLGALRPFDDAPKGDVLELSFGRGLVALLARQAPDRWLLLSGSDIRIDTAQSANSTTRFLGAAWLHAGLLAPATDGASYTVTRDLVFSSCSAVTQFCAGSKGRTVDSWRPIDPDGGYDPHTPALIAA